VWNNALQTPSKYLITLFIAYGAVSYVCFFIRLMHNWILGIVIAIGVAALVTTQTAKLGDKPFLIAFAIMLLGGPVLDILNLMRYHSLKNEVIRAEEERMNARYDDGYEDGYYRGMRDERRYRDEIEEEEYRRERLERRRHMREEYDYRDEDYEDYIEENDYGYDREDEYDEIEDHAGYEYYEEEDRYEEGNSENAAGFFADCKTPASIKRRYHDLCKVYHPDSGNGSSEIFYRIKDEYDRLNSGA
ncbi:MAG: J domain-containing protein, partial [Lachnospiraceae bacterium]|nr:J domain-containing protein [Lachnospiraceae bacterium]